MMHTPQQQHQPYADHELVKQVKALQQQVSQTLGQQQKVVMPSVIQRGVFIPACF
jgi:hypothetical protein